MSDGPEWFAPKRYGYGSGLPISWQGWVLTLGFVALAILLSVSSPTGLSRSSPRWPRFSLPSWSFARVPPAADGAGAGATTTSRR